MGGAKVLMPLSVPAQAFSCFLITPNGGVSTIARPAMAAGSLIK